jgi:hypothetical protein
MISQSVIEKGGGRVMKKLIGSIVSLLGFLFGVYVILTADSGSITLDVWTAVIGGVVICAFFGVNATMWIHGGGHKKNQ